MILEVILIAFSIEKSTFAFKVIKNVYKGYFKIFPNSQFIKQKVLLINLMFHLLNVAVAEWLSQ